jgi:hypothetical protein
LCSGRRRKSPNTSERRFLKATSFGRANQAANFDERQQLLALDSQERFENSRSPARRALARFGQLAGIEYEAAGLAAGRIDKNCMSRRSRRAKHVPKLVFHVAAPEPELTREARRGAGACLEQGE